jgi:hypothetical protein
MMTQASQQFVPIKEIRDGVVVLKSGEIRAVLMASSVNLSLKSEDEQAAVLLQFENFLNTVDFDIQICIQSRARDMGPYIKVLEERLKVQQEDLMRIQIEEYIEYIRKLSQEVNLMSKHFFVIVSYTGGGSVGSNLIDKFLPASKSKEDTAKQFEEAKSQLDQRVAVVEQTLTRTGVRIVQLGTAELTELYFKVFNPGAKNTITAMNL